MSKLNLKSSSPNKLKFSKTISDILDVLQFDGSIAIDMLPSQTDVIDVSLNKTIKWKMWLDTSTYDNITSYFINFFNSNNGQDSFICALRNSYLFISTWNSGDALTYSLDDLPNKILNLEVSKSDSSINYVKINDQEITNVGIYPVTLNNNDAIGGTGSITLSSSKDMALWDIEIYDNGVLLNNIKGYPNPDTSTAWNDVIAGVEANLKIADNHTPQIKQIITTKDLNSKLLLKVPVIPDFTITLDQVNAEYVGVTFDNAISKDGNIWTFEGNTQPHAILDDSSVTGTFNTIQFKEINGPSYSLSNNNTELTITSININQDVSIILGDSIYYSYHLNGELDTEVTTVTDASFNDFLGDTSVKAIIGSGFPLVWGYGIGKLGNSEWIMEVSSGSNGGTGEWSPQGEFRGSGEPYTEPYGINDLQPIDLLGSNIGDQFYMSGDHNAPLAFAHYISPSIGYIYDNLKFDYMLRKITVNHPDPSSQMTYSGNVWGPEESSTYYTWVYQWRDTDAYGNGGGFSTIYFNLDYYSPNWQILSVDGSQGGQVAPYTTFPDSGFPVFHIEGAKDISINASVGTP